MQTLTITPATETTPAILLVKWTDVSVTDLTRFTFRAVGAVFMVAVIIGVPVTALVLAIAAGLK